MYICIYVYIYMYIKELYLNQVYGEIKVVSKYSKQDL